MKSHRHIPIAITLTATLLGGRSVFAEKKDEKPDPALLTVNRIYGKSEFSAQRFSAQWLDDGSGYTTLENSATQPGSKDIVLHDPASGEKRLLVTADQLRPDPESTPLSIEGYTFSNNLAKVLIYTNSKRVWRIKSRGDYWVLDRTSRELRQLGGDATPATLQFARFSPSGDRVAFVRDNNIYVQRLDNFEVRAVTTTGSSHLINGTFDWVYEEELRLRDGFRWSPDGTRIAYWQIDTSGVREFSLVNNTAGLYPKITTFAYPKVGERNPAGRIGIVDLKTTETRWLDVPGDPRNHYIASLEWTDRPGELVLQQLNRLQNTNRLMLADARSLQTRTILVDRDDAWVEPVRKLRWLADGERFLWISERDGWSHVYLAGRSDDQPRLVTPGEYDVIDLLAVDEKSESIYFIASPDNPTQRYLYRVRLDGSDLERLTPSDQPGTHTYQIASGCAWAVHSYSTFDSPPVTDLINLSDHTSVRTLIDNKPLRTRLGKLKPAETEFLRVEIEDGLALDGWCIRPAEIPEGQKLPLLVYVYGEPAGSTVTDRWGGSSLLWHRMLVQQGYVVMSFDNRGTRVPRGRDWRKCIYRKVGIIAPKDQAAAVRAVIDRRPYLDPDRVGVWGWSGGGSMSLNAIFKFPDLYQAAIAIAPVPNQRYYDTIYQERYMGLPDDNVDGFRDGSPVNFAHQLKGDLLLIHGTGDDNCHYQTTEQLMNELIRHNKPFEMMAYPNRTHAIREGKNTTLHLRELMTSYLLEHLPPGPRE